MLEFYPWPVVELNHTDIISGKLPDLSATIGLILTGQQVGLFFASAFKPRYFSAQNPAGMVFGTRKSKAEAIEVVHALDTGTCPRECRPNLATGSLDTRRMGSCTSLIPVYLDFILALSQGSRNYENEN